MSLLQSNGEVVHSIRCKACDRLKAAFLFAPAQKESKWPICMECARVRNAENRQRWNGAPTNKKRMPFGWK